MDGTYDRTEVLGLRMGRRVVALLAGLVLAGSLVSARPLISTAAEQGGAWVLHNSGTEANLLDIAANDEIIVAVGGGGTLLTSTDGAGWVKRETGMTLDLAQVIWGNGRFVVLAKDYHRPVAVLSSADGIQWEVMPLEADLTDGSLRLVDGQFMLEVVGRRNKEQVGLRLTSADGKVWSEPASARAADPPRIAGQVDDTRLGWVEDQIYVARGGGPWTKWGRARLPVYTEPDMGKPGLNQLVYGNGSFVGWFFLRAPGGYVGWLGASADGRVWREAWMGSVVTISLVYGNKQFVAVTEGGLTLASRTGEAWRRQPSGADADLTKVIHAGTQFLAIGKKGTIVSRSDVWPWPVDDPQNRLHVDQQEVDDSGATVKLTLALTRTADDAPAPDGTAVAVTAYAYRTPLRLAESHWDAGDVRRATGTTGGGRVTLDLGPKGDLYFVAEEPAFWATITGDWSSSLGLKELLPSTLPVGPSMLPAIPIQALGGWQTDPKLQTGGSLEGVELTLLLQGSAWFIAENGRPLGTTRQVRISQGQLPSVRMMAEPGFANLSVWDSAGRMVGGLADLTWPTAGGWTGIICTGPDHKCSGNIVVADAPCAPFTDVMWTDPACPALQQMAGLKVTAGYADGSFRPAQQVTRAEFAKMLILTLQRQPEPDGALTFQDTAGHWAAKQGYVQAAVAGGMIQGFTDGTFRPDSPVSRAEAVKMVAAAAGLTPTEEEDRLRYLPYWDLNAADWYAGWVVAADDRLLIGRWAQPVPLWVANGFDGFAGAQPATRAEAVSLLANLWAQRKP